MEEKQVKTALMKVRFSIGAKLITIITVIVLMSLLSITALVSWLVREDLRIAAEENNLEVNRRSAMEAENTLGNIRSNSLLLIQTVNALGKGSAPAEEAVNFFFEQNPQVAALVFAGPSGNLQIAEPPENLNVPAQRLPEEFLVNKNFFLSRGIDEELTDPFFEKHEEIFNRAANGETICINAVPFFSNSLLALFFPAPNGGGGVLFSSSSLSDTFGFGNNQSCLLNNKDDILIHADFEQLRSALNIADNDFTRYARENPSRQAQTLYTDEDGKQYFGAFTKLETAGCMVTTTIEYNKVFEGITATTRRNIYLTSAVLFISIMLIWFFSKSISSPLKALAAAAQSIEGGSFDIHLRPKGHDEIGVLGMSFQRMSSALSIFGRFTNREIAVRAMRGEIKPGGLQKHATIFFSDIRNFTEKSENFTKIFGDDASDRIVSWLNEYLTNMVKCVEKTGGAVDKFIGDAVMAHWGTAYTAGTPKKDAFNCVMAALMMRVSLVKMNRARQSGDPGNPPIRIGCGINTGMVTAGQIGSDLRMEYTVIGDPVNLASRTEGLNKVFETDILITENTWNLVGDYFVTEEMPPVTVKGKEKPIRIFAVINLIGTKKGPKTLAELRELLGIKKTDAAIDGKG